MSETRNVGSVSVSVVPDASGWTEKFRAAALPGSDRIGEEIGAAIGGAMYDRVVIDIERIRAKLDELGRKDETVRVKVNDDGSIAATQEKLAGLNAAADSSSGGFNVLGGRILGVGTAAVAAADIAIPALLAVGAAAAGALAGAGVLALGFSGIGAALQAHGQPSPSSGAGSAAGKQQGALTLQSAQISAQQATQSATDQLTQAEQAQLAAEKGLHDARLQALIDLQDLDNKVKDNAISQQQAVLNLKDAQLILARDLSAPGASQPQYQDQITQARINVEKAQQQVNETTLTGARLTAQQTLAHKQGIDQAPAVVAAQLKLSDANHKLAEAQANVAITAEKNRIALAQAALSAQAAAGGVNAFGQAMSKLNPIQKQFVDFLLTLKPLFDELKLAASGFLPGLEQGIKNALPAFQPLLKVVGNVAAAMGQVFANIGAAFAGPGGQQFLNFLSVEMPKQIVFLGNLFIDFGKIFASVWEAAGPLIDAFDKAFLGVLDSITKAASGGGLKKFFDSLAPSIGPLFDLLGSVAKLIGTALVALAPALGPLADALAGLVTSITPLLPIIAQMITLSIPLLKFLTPLAPVVFGAVVAFTVLGPAIKGVMALLSAGPWGLVAIAVAALAAGLYLAYEHSQTFHDFVDAYVLPVLESLWNFLSGTLFPILKKIGEDALAGLVVAFHFVSQAVADHRGQLNDLVHVFEVVVNFIVTKILPILGPILKAAFEGLGVSIALGIDAIAGVITVTKDVFGSIAGIVRGALDAVLTVFHDMTQPLKTAWNAIWSALGTVGSDVLAGIRTAIDGVIAVINIGISAVDAIIDSINAVSGSLSDLWTWAGIPGIPKIPDIPHVGGDGSVGLPPPSGVHSPSTPGTYHARALGGPVFAGHLYAVGDNPDGSWNRTTELFVPKVDGTIFNQDHLGAAAKMMNRGTDQRPVVQNIYTNDPLAAAHEAVNRMAARAV